MFAHVAAACMHKAYIVGKKPPPYRLGNATYALYPILHAIICVLQLDGAAPEGHPDNSAITIAAASAPSSRTRAQAAAAAANAIAASNGSSNGSNNGTTSIRRMRSSRTRAAASNSSSSSSSGVAAAAAAALAAAAAEQQQQQQSHHHHQQHDVPSSSSSSSSSAQQQHLASTAAGAAEHASPLSSSSSSSSVPAAVSPLSSDSEDDAEAASSDKELQAEFHDSNCCQDILDIVADELPRFAPFHTVTALNRLAKLVRGSNWEARREVLAEESFVKLLGKLHAQVDAGRLNAFQLSTSLYSCATLQVGLVLGLTVFVWVRRVRQYGVS
jgi:hypothetical protein